MQNVGQQIRDARVRAGLTQTELAKGICTPAMISQIESGKARPSIALLGKLSEKLELKTATQVPEATPKTLAAGPVASVSDQVRSSIKAKQAQRGFSRRLGAVEQIARQEGCDLVKACDILELRTTEKFGCIDDATQADLNKIRKGYRDGMETA